MINQEEINFQEASCPLPLTHTNKILMGHGSGGKMSDELIKGLFLPPFDNPILNIGDDAGVLNLFKNGRIAISTDSHVISPLFYPGGDIGKLAICGTVNDISMVGAKPIYLTAGFILEEGLPMPTLKKIVSSMKSSAAESNIDIVAGDTKVVAKGDADGIYINTSGIGVVPKGVRVSGAYAKPGDLIIVSGFIGDHGISVLSARSDIGFETGIESDTAPLNHLVSKILDASQTANETYGLHVLRDPTRGGLATSLNEIAKQSQIGIMLDETKIPVRPAVSAACEMLGFDPLYIANEGKLIAIVKRDVAKKVLDVIRSSKYGEDAVIIGEVLETPSARVLMKTAFGSTRVINVMAGEMLPRIC